MDLERLADDVSDRLARVQRGVRILKDDLDILAAAGASRALLGVDVDPVEGELAGGRLLQPHQHPANVDLPQPDSPTMPSVSPL